MTDLFATLHRTFDFWRLEHSPHEELQFVGRPKAYDWLYVQAKQRPGERLDDFLLRVASDGTRRPKEDDPCAS